MPRPATLLAQDTTPTPEVEAAFHAGTAEAFRLAGYAVRDLAGPMPRSTKAERAHERGYLFALSLIACAIESAAEGKRL